MPVSTPVDLVINTVDDEETFKHMNEQGLVNDNELYLVNGEGYTHPSYTPRTIGLYKISVDDHGHVSNVSEVTKDDLINLGMPSIVRASTEITVENTSVIPIPFSIENPSSLSVYHDGILLVPNVHYTATTTDITLDYTAKVGSIFTFIGTSLTGLSLNTTAAEITILDADANFTGVTTVEGALKYIADNWKPLIQEIYVNGTKIDPTNGNVYISTISSLSLNGSNLTPDTTGKITLNNIMKNDETQTMQAKLIAQSNTDYAMKQVRNIFLVPKSNSDNLPTGSSGDICIIYKDS